MLGRIKRKQREVTPEKRIRANVEVQQSKTPDCKRYENLPLSLKIERSDSKNMNRKFKNFGNKSKTEEKSIKQHLPEAFQLPQSLYHPRDFYSKSPIRKQKTSTPYLSKQVVKNSVSLRNSPESFNNSNYEAKNQEKASHQKHKYCHSPKMTERYIEAVQGPIKKLKTFTTSISSKVKPLTLILTNSSAKISSEKNKTPKMMNKLDLDKAKESNVYHFAFAPTAKRSLSSDEPESHEVEDREQKYIIRLLDKAKAGLMKNQLKVDGILIKLSKLSLIV